MKVAVRRMCVAGVLLLVASLGWGQPEPQSGPAPEVLLLARIKGRMEDNLRRQPNYTCMETIERSVRRTPSRRYRLVDTVRLEVAVVEGKEMFSWPGAGEFKDQDIRELVPTGAIGTGSFTLHARSVFLSRVPTYTYVGEEQLGDRRCVRYDYEVPLLWSGYRLRMNQDEARVGYHGSFWVDADSLDLVRLDVHADDIPARLRLSAVDLTIEYRRMKIGRSEFLLPFSAVTTLVHTRGDTSRNVTRFSDCRQYGTESFLSFDEPPPAPASAPPPPVEVTLPAGLEFDLELRTPITSGRSAVGDELTALVPANVRRNKRVVIPKGAVVSGRLVRLERVRGREDYFVVGIELDTLTFGHHRARLAAELTAFPSYVAGGVRPLLKLGRGRGGSPAPPSLRGTGVFYVKGGRLYIPPGARMRWRTIAVSDEGKR